MQAINSEQLEIENAIFQRKIEDIMNGKAHLSYSSLSKFLESPYHYKQHVLRKTEPTPAMIEGKIFHLACLEPERFKEKYFCLDDSKKVAEIGGAKPRGTAKYKEWKAEQLELNQGKEMLSPNDYVMYQNMCFAIRNNRSTKKFYKNIVSTEEEFLYEYDGFLIKGFKDLTSDLGSGITALSDLKKVANASYRKCRWDIDEKNYDMQSFIYSASGNFSEYYLQFIDKGLNISLVKLSEKTIKNGQNKLDVALSEFTRCAEENLWDSSYEFYNGGYIEH